MSKEISSDAQAVIAKAGEGAEAYVREHHTEGDRITSGEAGRLLANFTAIPSDIATGDTGAPTGGLSGIYDRLTGELGIGDLESAVSAAKGDLAESKAAGVAQQQALRDRPESINLIRGRQQQAGLMQSQEEQALVDQANLTIDELNFAKGELNTRYGIEAQEYQTIQNVMLNNPQAGIKIGDSMATITTKLGNWQEDMADDIRKQSLQDTAMMMGIKTSGSIKDLQKRIRNESKDALEKTNILIDQQITSGQIAINNAQLALSSVPNVGNTMTSTDLIDQPDHWGVTPNVSSNQTPAQNTESVTSGYLNTLYK